MTKKEKDLVIKDLCARLPYDVIVDYAHNAYNIHKGYYIKHDSKCILSCYLLDIFISPRQNEEGEYIKPYLFPLSSMTKEQLFDVQEILGKNEIEIEDGFLRILDSDRNTISYLEILALLEWFYKNHFDINGLIEKGLAIDATGLNIY